VPPVLLLLPPWGRGGIEAPPIVMDY
jgi:hypothetical protein